MKKLDLTKLALKSVKFHEDMSEETGCFSAILVEDGVCVAHVTNNGQGGSNSYSHYGSDRSINLYNRYGGIDADCHIMGLAEDWNSATKYQNKGLVLKMGDVISTVGFGTGLTIGKLKKKYPPYPTWIKEQVKKWEGKGYTVLNRNL